MNPKTLQAFLERRAGREIDLRVNDNMHNLITVFRPRGKPLRVSVHRMFLDAPAPVRNALVSFVKGPTKRARAEIRRFICENRSRVRTRPTRKQTVRLEPAGQYFHLRRIAGRLNRQHFDGRLKFDITWGRRPGTPPKQLNHIQLGNYNERLRLIRVHPILDVAITPLYYLEYIVYHEMAHVVVPPEVDEQGRVCHHTKRFYALEKKFPDYQRAIRWQKRRLESLIDRYCSRPRRRRIQQLTLF
jgi:hypothetical protein